MIPLSIDILLALFLMVLAGRIIIVGDDFQAVVIFISFGILMALSWLRLSAPDIALAEAAIGGGALGALLLSSLPSQKKSKSVNRGGSDADGL